MADPEEAKTKMKKEDVQKDPSENRRRRTGVAIPIQVGENWYPSKNKAKEAVDNVLERSIDHEYYRKTKVKQTDSVKRTGKMDRAFEFLFAAFISLHPESAFKLSEIVDFAIEEHDYSKYKALCARVVRCDGSIGEFVSFKTAIDHYNTSGARRKTFIRALRASVKPQIDAFRRDVTPKICAICGVDLTSCYNEVDHSFPSFIRIADNFLKDNPHIEMPKGYAYQPHGTNGFPFSFKDEDNYIETRFFKYHKKHANLRLLCQNCNEKAPRQF